MRRKLTTALLALTLLATLTPRANAHHTGRAHGADIVDTAIGAGGFETLVAAVQAAGLVETLEGPGPFTVFAPTDEAFAALPPGTVERLLEPANRDALRALLTYHVVAGRVPAAAAGALRNAETVNGQRVAIKVEEGRLKIDQATVQSADIGASNGIIHVIDGVLLPADQNIVSLAQAAGSFETLLAAATAAGLADTLTGSAPLTVFAPTDEAFAKLPEGTVERLLAEEGLTTLERILTYHVVAGRVYSDQALAAQRVHTVNGERLAVRFADGRVRINDAALVANDLDASNGVVHVIDTVLLPPEVRAASARPAEMTTGASADSVIRLAIQRGVPLFNDGNPGACAAIYEVAVTSLLNGGYDLPSAARTALETSLRNAAREDDDRGRAWALRYGLDDARQALHERMASRTHR